MNPILYELYIRAGRITLSISAQNLLDQDAEELDFGPGTPNNLLGGKYYETSPFGFNGGFYYVKATYSF